MRVFYKILLHILGCVALVSLIIWVVFYVYLPSASRHGEYVTVPNVVGMHVSELSDFLSGRRLTFRVSADSDFSIENLPLTILKQSPGVGAQVKERRKIVVILNATNPPPVVMPNLVDGSVKNAQILLKTYRLRLGRINYRADMAQNAVLAQYLEGNPVEGGELVPQGASIDLDVGDGLGQQTFPTPNLLGINEQEVESIIISSGLRLGKKMYRPSRNRLTYRVTPEGDSLLVEDRVFAEGLILDQSPEARIQVRIGDYIDIWVAGNAPQK